MSTITLHPALWQLEDFYIQSCRYDLSNLSEESDLLVKAENLRFKLGIELNRKEPRLIKINFTLKSSPASKIDLEVTGAAVVRRPPRMREEKVREFVATAIIPTIYSTLRGYVYSSGPFPIFLPLVNFIEAYKRASEENSSHLGSDSYTDKSES